MAGLQYFLREFCLKILPGTDCLEADRDVVPLVDTAGDGLEDFVGDEVPLFLDWNDAVLVLSLLMGGACGGGIACKLSGSTCVGTGDRKVTFFTAPSP